MRKFSQEYRADLRANMIAFVSDQKGARNQTTKNICFGYDSLGMKIQAKAVHAVVIWPFQNACVQKLSCLLDLTLFTKLSSVFWKTLASLSVVITAKSSRLNSTSRSIDLAPCTNDSFLKEHEQGSYMLEQTQRGVFWVEV